MCDVNIGIMDVVNKNGIKITGRSGASLLATCPFCNGKGKFWITPSMDQFHCFKCDEAGNHVSLEYKLNPSEYNGDKNYPKFLRNMEEFLNTGEATESTGYELINLPSLDESVERASDEYCSKVYYKLLSLLTLSPEHEKDLKRRGLTDEDIKRFKFKTSPKYSERFSIPKKLIGMGLNLEGVPGFYMEGNSWALKTPASSYLCPVFERNLILGFQTRLDKPLNDNKYMWLSSTGKKKGVSSGTLAGILPGKYDKSILIVEGTLKAIVVYCLLKGELTVVSVPGVNSLKCLESILADYEGQIAIECYDSDKFLTEPILSTADEENKKKVRKVKTIQDAVGKLEQKCSEYNMLMHHMTWNLKKEFWAEGADDTVMALPEDVLNNIWTGEGKGLDDFLLAYEKKELFVNHVITKTENLLRLKKCIA